MRCDFCLDPLASGPGWLYPCRAFAVLFLAGDKVLGNAPTSTGPWSACVTCHLLLAAGDLAALERRMRSGFLRRTEPTFERMSPADHATVASIADQAMHALLTCFLANRVGDPSPIGVDG